MKGSLSWLFLILLKFPCWYGLGQYDALGLRGKLFHQGLLESDVFLGKIIVM